MSCNNHVIKAESYQKIFDYLDASTPYVSTPENRVPIIPANAPNNKYKVPMSL
jgi:hypothetical protein